MFVLIIINLKFMLTNAIVATANKLVHIMLRIKKYFADFPILLFLLFTT